MEEQQSHDQNASPAAGSPVSGELPLRRKLAFWTITLLVGLVGAIGVGEMVARIIRGRDLTPEELAERLRRSEATEIASAPTGNLRGLVKPSVLPDVVYELKPGRQWIFQGAVTRTNSHGFRGGEWAARRPPGTLRVVGLGDSVMFGWGVDNDLMYTAQLEGLLQNAVPGHRVEVLNCAVPGYNSVQEVATFEHRCLEFEPNVVLLGYCTNDWTEPFFMRAPEGDRLVNSSVLARWIEEGRYQRREGLSLDEARGAEKSAAALRRLAGLAREKQLPVVFFVAPDPANEQVSVPDETLARSLGFTVVDVTATLHQRRPLVELVLSRQDSHPNAEGHRLIAEALRPAVVAALKAAVTTP